jgi:hypothetical protein
MCGGFFDMRDPGTVLDHEGPLPHPETDGSSLLDHINREYNPAFGG